MQSACYWVFCVPRNTQHTILTPNRCEHCECHCNFLNSNRSFLSLSLFLSFTFPPSRYFFPILSVLNLISIGYFRLNANVPNVLLWSHFPCVCVCLYAVYFIFRWLEWVQLSARDYITSIVNIFCWFCVPWAPWE